MGLYLPQLGGSKPGIFLSYHSHCCNGYVNIYNYGIAAPSTFHLLATFMMFSIIPPLQPNY